MVDAKTKGGKTIRIEKVANSSLYKVAFATGGELPKSLSGMWTSPIRAKQAIEHYLESKTTTKQPVAGNAVTG